MSVTMKPGLSMTRGASIPTVAAESIRGTQAGDRIVVISHNHADIVDIVLGILLSDRVPVLLNPGLGEKTLADLVTDADPKVVLADEDIAAMLTPWRPRLIRDVVDERLAVDRTPWSWPRARPMHYTSGTTGRSKGVDSGRLSEEDGRLLAEEERGVWGFRPSDVHLVVSPLYHSAPFRFAQNTILYGGCVLVLERFDPDLFLAVVEEFGVTTTFVTPTHLGRLLTSPGWSSRDLSSLRLVAHAGAPCPTATKAAACVRLPGVVWEFYGSTEGQFTVLPPDEWPMHPLSVGRARLGRELVIAHGDSLCQPGEVGTIWSSCPRPARFSYWRDEAKTRAAWRDDLGGREGPWFSVGDLGSMDDDGYLTISGRRTDLIITGGVNVYPAEVERTLLEHPDVAEAVVFGVPDDDWGQRVCAAVVPVSGRTLTPRPLRNWVRDRMAGFQTPKSFTVLERALPRSASGKIRRDDLAAWIANHTGEAIDEPLSDQGSQGDGS